MAFGWWQNEMFENFNNIFRSQKLSFKSAKRSKFAEYAA